MSAEGKIDHKIEGKYSYYKAKPDKLYKVLDFMGNTEKIIRLPI